MHINILDKVQELLARKNKKAAFIARQLMMMNSPLSALVENYLYNNEGQPQNLNNFPMMRQIYDYMPQRLILKCSRKTLKSTLISNILVLNTIRYNFYKQLYIAPQEATTKYFSNNYLNARFDSPSIKRLTDDWKKYDVFEKILAATNSGVLLRYASEDATRIRGPATDHNILDEVQDILFDVLPIIGETMSLSPYKREIYAGTPLTTTNTINKLWISSNRMEWMMKCTHCNRWNGILEDNEPLKMIQSKGFCCSKCGNVIDSRKGEWVSFSPEQTDLIGYHLAQPMLPQYNESPKEWARIYKKVTDSGYGVAQIYNEVFGLAYDIGVKPITEEQLRQRCVLGPMIEPAQLGTTQLAIYEKNKYKYRLFTCGVDWGVNMQTSRTTVCIGAMRDDLVYEVFYMKTYKTFDYEKHITEIAEIANKVHAFCASDSGPDPIRGIKLLQLTGSTRTQLVRYEHGKFIQHTDIPKEAIDPVQNRWCLHRSDTISLTLRMIKEGRILFPRWEDAAEGLRDILSLDIEVKDGLYRQELFYRHDPDLPDDFVHALNFAFCQALVAIGDPLLQGPSSSSAGVEDS